MKGRRNKIGGGAIGTSVVTSAVGLCPKVVILTYSARPTGACLGGAGNRSNLIV